jgi:hypothetical protein
MKPIMGLDIDFDFGKLIKISDLIYFDGPLLSHYTSERGDNYLYYWVDVDDTYNRWLIIRTDIFSIQQYLDKKIPLYSIISNPNDSFVYAVDIDSDAVYHNVKAIRINDLPENYLPSPESYYDFELNDDIDLAAISRKHSSGIFELHVDGTNVKYGSIPFNKFAPIMPMVEDIRKSMSSRYIKQQKSLISNKETQKDIVRTLALDTQYEYICSLAGSIRIILKPLNTQTQLSFDENVGKTFADDFAEEMINLFKSGYEKEKLITYSDFYDKNVIKKYNEFINYLDKEKLSFGLKWYNSVSNISIKENIKLDDTKKILNNLSDFEFDKNEEIRLDARFYSLNVKTGNYSLESAEGDDFKSTGFLDGERKKIADTISFNKTYKVIIERKVSEQIGSKEKTIDTLISLIEIKD